MMLTDTTRAIVDSFATALITMMVPPSPRTEYFA